jgi:hypothetical protein
MMRKGHHIDDPTSLEPQECKKLMACKRPTDCNTARAGIGAGAQCRVSTALPLDRYWGRSALDQKRKATAQASSKRPSFHSNREADHRCWSAS